LNCPADIEKLLADPAFAGVTWSVKNLLELKNARRVTIRGNVLENNWVSAQAGFAILFTVRNEDGAAPWAVIEDVEDAPSGVVFFTPPMVSDLSLLQAERPG
jgi:hypothetical protein